MAENTTTGRTYPHDGAARPDYAVIEQFTAAMREHGIDIDEPIIADGKLHRYHVAGDKKRSRNAWAKLVLDEHPAGMYGCNKRYAGEKFTWTMQGTRALTPDERRELKATAKARAAQRQAETEMLNAQAAEFALAVYNEAQPVTEHPYLALKGVPSAPKLRIGNWYYIDEETGEQIRISDRALIVPLFDPAQRIHSLQAILEDRDGGWRKQYLKNGVKEGKFCPIGKPRDNVILICEGLATGLSLWQCTGHAVVVAFDAGNLKPVALEARRIFPDATILLCADNDAWTHTPIENPGVHFARNAAAAVDGRVVYPTFTIADTKPSDFNDLHQLEGEEPVRQIIARALVPLIEAPETSIAEEAAHVEEAAELPPEEPSEPDSGDCGPPSAIKTLEANTDDESKAKAPQSVPGAMYADAASEASPICLEDFYAYMPAHSYIYTPTREMWPAASVNARLPSTGGKKPAAWLDANRPIEQMVWHPGSPQVIPNELVADGGWIDRQGVNTFNLYLPPLNLDGDAQQAAPWIDHIRLVYPDDLEHLLNWMAHRVQRPAEKINHALVLGGLQGIGKDTLLEPTKHAVGPWNFFEVSPAHLLGRFNSFIKSVVLRVSEARDLGDIDRYAFYDHMKTYTASPPDVLRCDEKNLREHSVFNVCGVIITSNHKSDGIYLPADDRRHYVAWSGLTKDDFTPDYWRDLWGWYEGGGFGHVAAYLQQRDLSGFDAKAPPRKTAAWHEIVNANRAPEDAELADALDVLDHPLALTVLKIANVSVGKEFRDWLLDRRNSRQIPHRLEAAGYVRVSNDADKHNGLWRVSGKRQAIYAKVGLPPRDRIAAAQAVCRGEEP